MSAARVLCALLAVAPALSGCLAVRAPRAGEAVEIGPGQCLVFGRIRMVDATDRTIEYEPFRFDPWGGPFFSPLPRLSLELRQQLPPGGAIVYRSHPDPEVAADGRFAWVLPAGSYALLGNPRLLASKRYRTWDTRTLASFTVPPCEAALYVGTLVVDVGFGVVEAVRGWKRDEADYAIAGIRVVDDTAGESLDLRRRLPGVTVAPGAALMQAAPP